MAVLTSSLSALQHFVCVALDSWPLPPSVHVMPVIDGSQAGLGCTYDAIPQKKGPKGSRAKVISELRLREGQKKAEHRRQDSTNNYASPASSLASPVLSGLLTHELIDGCMDFYFTHMYPTIPILHNEQLWRLVADIDTSVETYCLVASFCAFMLIQTGVESKAPQAIKTLAASSSNASLGKTLLDEALRRRKGCDIIEKPSVNAIITSFFLFGCCFGLDKHNTAWFHLREATTLAQIIGMQDEKTYTKGSYVETASMRRLFWLLFVTERAYALQKHRPLTLHATINLPCVAEDPSKQIAGFLHLVNLFRPFDDTFIGLWNKSRTDCSTLCTETQAADLRTTQHWLRTMVWQLSITNGYLSSTSPDSSMTFGYPIEIAKDLVAVTSQLSRQSMEVHGVGLIEKLFDVACTLIDVMSCVPLESQNFGVGPQDYLNHLIHLISTLRGGESRYLPLLVTKIRDTLPPHMAASITQPMVPIKVEHNSPEATPFSSLCQHDSSENQSSSTSSPYSTPPILRHYPPS
ncbi:MAG: hypothetical protein Q9201_006342 [Fulgogasparrea decipioides]